MTYTPYDEDLEEENARLREEVAQLKAAQAWAAQGATRTTASPSAAYSAADDAEWADRIRAASSPDEVMAIVAEQEQARELADPSESEMEAALTEYHTALAQASSPAEAAALEQSFLRANLWAMDE